MGRSARRAGDPDPSQRVSVYDGGRGVLGVIGVPVPRLWMGIACSGVVLGLFVALAIRPRLCVAMLLVAAFAVFHGHAHGTVLPAFGVLFTIIKLTV